MRFSVWLHEGEAEGEDGLGLIKAKRALENGGTDGPSISEAMERGLKEVSKISDEIRSKDEAGVIVSKVSLEGASVKVVSQEDFIEGKGLK
jgi:hypothetical protein